MRLYSKGCEYAIRVLLETPEGENNFLIKTACKKSRVPESFTRKMFQKLVRKGVLKASQGPGGGYAFKVLPKDISILRLVKLLDGELAMKGCILGFSQCHDRVPCPLHHSWQSIRSHVISNLDTLTLEGLRRTFAKKPRKPSHVIE